jgi:soluble lytic murein transglycosylase-like protein
MRVICIFFIFLMISINASADMYQTTSDDGSVIYSNQPAAGSRTIIKDEKPARKSISNNHRSGSNYHSIVDEKSRKHNVDPKLVKAVISAESGWNPMAISPKGAVGIMQLMPKTASDMGVGNRFNPEQNIEGGVKYLRFLLDKFNGNMTLTLAAYNAGPARVERVKGVPSIPETINYVKRVMNTYSGGIGTKWLSGGQSPKIRMVTLEDGSVLYTNAFSPGSLASSN